MIVVQIVRAADPMRRGGLIDLTGAPNHGKQEAAKRAASCFALEAVGRHLMT
jgi:hypothetical protein